MSEAPGLDYSPLAAGAPAEGVPMRGLTAGQAVGMPVVVGGAAVSRVEARPLPTPYCHYDVALPDSDDEERPPIFLGATNGHWPLAFNCPACHYSGQTTTRKEKGWAWGVGAMITFGITALLGCGHDTHHYCPRCNKHLAFAKLM